MLSFKQYMTEATKVKDRIWTAVKAPPSEKHPNGKILRGQHRTTEHADIRMKHADMEGPAKGEAGYYDPIEKRFYTRDEFAHEVSGTGSGDSKSLLSAAERMMGYGSGEPDPFAGHYASGSPGSGAPSSHDMQSPLAMARKGIFEHVKKAVRKRM